VWVDVETLATNHETSKHELAAAEEYLSQWVPENRPYPVNYNTSNFLLWWLYEHLSLPVIARTKTGKPSANEATVMELAEIHPVGKGLLNRGKWSKYCTSFFGPYSEQLDSNHRIHTSFKLYGTVTGRTSSGKEEEEKITAKRQIRGVNMQQVPRDVFVRGIFGAPPGWSFVEADFSQIELRIAAFLACEETMLHLYATGQDIHMAMAMTMTGKPQHAVSKEERKKAKAVNFGFLYGMGWAKFVKTAWANYGVRVTEAESKAFRQTFFDQFPKLVRWHAKQRMMVNKYARVESPVGRIRHLPDIRSPHQDVRAEAERQAINSPVQSFASDLLIMSMVDIDREFRRQGMRARPIGTVHDSCNFEIPNGELSVALPIIKNTMENLPLYDRFKLNLTVPIIADLKVGTRWGGAREISTEEVYAWSA
jgi:DNA polymerase-1